MFKRVVWFVVGAVAGAGGSAWAQRKIKAQVERVQPARLVGSAGDALRAAVADGRSAMREREFDLRQRYGLEAPPPHDAAPVPPMPGPARRAHRRR